MTWTIETNGHGHKWMNEVIRLVIEAREVITKWTMNRFSQFLGCSFMYYSDEQLMILFTFHTSHLIQDQIIINPMPISISNEVFGNSWRQWLTKSYKLKKLFDRRLIIAIWAVFATFGTWSTSITILKATNINTPVKCDVSRWLKSRWRDFYIFTPIVPTF